jgi:hypothetical protein
MKKEMKETVDGVRITHYRESIERYIRYLSSRPYEKNEPVKLIEKEDEMANMFEQAKRRAGDVQKIRILAGRSGPSDGEAILYLLHRDGDVWTPQSVKVRWEERRKYYDVAWTSCEACIEDQPNQQAHMEFGGCLEEADAEYEESLDSEEAEAGAGRK